MVQSTCHLFDSRRQLVYRIAHGSVEFIQFSPTHSPVKRPADIGAAQPELNVVKFVDHGVLIRYKPRASRHGRGRTLIIVSRTLTEPKTALAGVMLETSFAMFMASMAAFSEEMALPRPLGRWDPASMVEADGDRKKATQCVVYEEGPER